MYHANGMTNRARAFLASQKPKIVTEAQITAAQDQLVGMSIVMLNEHVPAGYGRYAEIDDQAERRAIRRMLEAAVNAA